MQPYSESDLKVTNCDLIGWANEVKRVTGQKAIIPIGQIEERILLIRGQRVMLDTDLAGLYGTTTKRLNEQVKRNRGRFPEDFMFQLTKMEKA